MSNIKDFGKIKDGGTAFPCEGGEMSNLAPDPGMSLRDYFAAQALSGLCANPGGPFQQNSMSGWGPVNCGPEDIANEAFRLADAFLAAREKSNA